MPLLSVNHDYSIKTHKAFISDLFKLLFERDPADIVVVLQH